MVSQGTFRRDDAGKSGAKIVAMAFASLASLGTAAVIAVGCGAGQSGKSGAASGSSETIGDASVRILEDHPVTLMGDGFTGGERLTVVINDGGSWVRRTNAAANGSFRLDLTGIPLDRCTGFQVRVSGAAGEQVLAASPPFACPPAP